MNNKIFNCVCINFALIKKLDKTNSLREECAKNVK